MIHVTNEPFNLLIDIVLMNSSSSIEL